VNTRKFLFLYNSETQNQNYIPNPTRAKGRDAVATSAFVKAHIFLEED
jgi:hypothetical protein